MYKILFFLNGCKLINTGDIKGYHVDDEYAGVIESDCIYLTFSYGDKQFKLMQYVRDNKSAQPITFETIDGTTMFKIDKDSKTNLKKSVEAVESFLNNL